MIRIRSNKQYSVRITHPVFGEYYYSHYNWDKRQYIFTQKLSSVSKWKTKKTIDKNIDQISKINNRTCIIFQVGVVKGDEKPILGNGMFVFRKRIYQKVVQVIKKSDISESTEKMESIYDNLKTGLKDLNNLFDDDDSFIDVQYEEETKGVFNRFVQNMNLYKKYQNRVIKATKLRKNNELIYIDIVNSSFNFRGLKLKNLMTFDDD